MRQEAEAKQVEAGGDATMDDRPQEPEIAGDEKESAKKISTHGQKDSGRAEYKRRKGFKLRRGKATTDFRASTARRKRDGMLLLEEYFGPS